MAVAGVVAAVGGGLALWRFFKVNEARLMREAEEVLAHRKIN
jgi:hypothetical protein